MPSQSARADTRHHEPEDLTALSGCLVSYRARTGAGARNLKPRAPVSVNRKPETYHNSEAETCNLQPTHPPIIESDGFPTSSWCGARRRRLLAGGVLRVGIFAVLFVFWGVVGGGYGGAASDGSTGQSQASMRRSYVFRGVPFGAVSEVQHAVIEYKRTKRRAG